MPMLVLFGVALILGVLLPWYVLDPVSTVYPFDGTQFCAWFILEYSTLRLAWLSAQGKPRYLSLTFFVFVYVWAGLSVIAQLMEQRFPWIRMHHPPDAMRAMVIIIMAVVSYDLGQLATRIRSWREPVWRVEYYFSERAIVYMCFVAIALFALGVVMLGNPLTLFKTRAQFEAAVNTQSKMGEQITIALIRSPAFTGFMAAIYAAWVGRKLLPHKTLRALIWATLLMALVNVGANFPGSLTRTWLSVVAMTPVFALVSWRRWMAPVGSVGLVLLVIVVFPYLDAFRYAPTFSQGLDALTIAPEMVKPLVHKGDFDVFQQTANSVVFVAGRGLEYGRNLVGALLFWVPRALWHGKPYGTGSEIALFLNYPNNNLSAPLWVESYVSFGYGGVVLLIGFYGWCSARAERAYLAALSSQRGANVIGIAVPFWAAYQFYTLRGDLLTTVSYVLLPILLTACTLRRRLVRSPTAAPAGPPEPRLALARNA